MRLPNLPRLALALIAACCCSMSSALANERPLAPEVVDAHCKVLFSLYGMDRATCHTALSKGGDADLAPAQTIAPTPAPQPEIIQTNLPAASVDTGSFSVAMASSSSLSAEVEQILNKLANALRLPEFQGTCIKLVGHADTIGAEDANARVSLRRAELVRRFLEDRIGTEGFGFWLVGAGETSPLPGVAGSDPRNRRVEIFARKGLGDCG